MAKRRGGHGRTRATTTTAVELEVYPPGTLDLEHVDLAAAEDRYADLRRRFGSKGDLIHGTVKAAEKDAARARAAVSAASQTARSGAPEASATFRQDSYSGAACTRSAPRKPTFPDTSP